MRAVGFKKRDIPWSAEMLTVESVDEVVVSFETTADDAVSLLLFCLLFTTLEVAVSLLDDCALLLAWLELDGATLVVVLELAVEVRALFEEELTELLELVVLDEELELELEAASGLNP